MMKYCELQKKVMLWLRASVCLVGKNSFQLIELLLKNKIIDKAKVYADNLLEEPTNSKFTKGCI